jgi:hypothetical protein
MTGLKDMDCVGRAQRRRRFGPREGRWRWRSAWQVLSQKRRRAALAAAVQKVTDNFGMVRQEKTDGLEGASPSSTDMHDNTKT